MFIANISFILIDKRNQLTGYYNESELFKRLLSEKEKELSRIQNFLNQSSTQNTGQLLEKIEVLKDDIEKLRENENDQIPAEVMK
jgi:N-glycosylase/DNA lyase